MKVQPMSVRRIASLVIVAMMTLPVLAIIGPAAEAQTQETVPFAPGVRWVPQTQLLQSLFVRFPNAAAPTIPTSTPTAPPESTQPNCAATADVEPRATLTPVRLESTPTNPRAACAFVASGQAVPQQEASFRSAPLTHGFNVTTNDSLRYVHVGDIPTGMRMTVLVIRGGTTIGQAEPFTKTDTNNFVVPIRINKLTTEDREEFKKNDEIVIRIRGEIPPNSNLPAGQPAQWTISDAGSRLEVRTSDGFRIAAWSTDDLGSVRELYKPFPDNSTIPPGGIPRIVGFFAVQSPFGLVDANSQRRALPNFTLERGGRAVPVGPDEAALVPAIYNESSSSPTEGIAIWNFAPGQLDYRGLSAGEYNLTVTFDYHQGGGFRATSRVLLSEQSVLLVPYDDADPTTLPSPLETQSHELAPSGRTTYLLLARNTGSVNDTFRLDAQFVSGSPSGWGASLGGPGVLDRLVQLRPGESKLVKLTVQAPQGAGVGATSIFQVTATSLLDPTARSPPITFISTISANVRHDVGVIVPSTSVDLPSGEELRIPVHVWNRGTRAANISLEVREVPAVDWAADLVQGVIPLKRVVLTNVQPGDIATLDLRVTGPTTQPEMFHDVTLNATSTDVSGVADESTIRFHLKPQGAVRVRVLETIGTIGHVVETGGGAAGQPCPVGVACSPDDGMDAVLWRVWITNTGRRFDRFILTLDSIDWSRDTGCEDTVFTHTLGERFKITTINDQGVIGGSVSSVELQPGQTAEVYVYNEMNRFASLCPVRQPQASVGPDFIRWSLQARGESSNVQDRASGRAEARDKEDTRSGGAITPNAPLIEAVERDANYGSNRLVNITQAHKRTLVGGARVGENVTYYVRVTHGGGWANWMDDGTLRNSDLRLTLAGVDREGGWNVSIRNRTTLDLIQRPHSDNLTLSNQYNGKRVAWIDREIEVVVQPPNGRNGTGLAGDEDQFTMTVDVPGTGARSTLEISTRIVEIANIDLVPDQTRVFAHPGDIGAYLLYVNNSGSSEANVTLRASVNATNTPNAAAWTVEPASQQFTLPAFKNRTVALLVRPPASATQGTTGDLDVSVEYAPNPFEPTKTVNKTVTLTTEVVPRLSLRLTPGSNEATIAPNGTGTFTMTLQNTGTQALNYRIVASPVPNWTLTLSPQGERTLAAGESIPVVVVLNAPSDVVSGSRFSSIVRVEEILRPDNFDVQVVSVNILGGKAIPSLSVPKIQKTVDRAGAQNFEVNVKNVGTATERIALTVRVGDPSWQAYVQNARGENITGLTLAPNDLTQVNVTVRAPFLVPENTLVPVEIIAEAGGQTAKQTLQALVHDFGVHIEMTPTRLDAIAGLPTEWTIRIRNDGNDNDTLNVSAHLLDIPTWSVELATETVRLEPGQVGDIRAIVKPPTDPLPTPRAYTLKFFVGTRGGQAVNITKNESIAAVVNILNYRAVDVDRDDQLELAVDFDRSSTNGFERFQEIFPSGSQAVVTATGHINGRTNFFLDVPRDRPYDGIADVWFDPETVYVYDIRHAPDLSFDQGPDYLLDTDRDGRVDRAYDAVGGQFWNALEIKAFGDDRIQYLADVTNDGRPDRFYDPEQRLVTRTTRIQGNDDLVGIDTTNDNKENVDKVYDIKTQLVTDAKVSGFVDFARQYWYFFLAFVALVGLTVLIVARRRRGP